MEPTLLKYNLSGCISNFYNHYKPTEKISQSAVLILFFLFNLHSGNAASHNKKTKERRTQNERFKTFKTQFPPQTAHFFAVRTQNRFFRIKHFSQLRPADDRAAYPLKRTWTDKPCSFADKINIFIFRTLSPLLGGVTQRFSPQRG